VDDDMTVQVRLFALLRQRAGRDRMQLSLPSGATVGEALRELCAQAPLGDMLERMPVGVAVNRQYARAETRLRDGDELALIPPVSGGQGGERVHVRVGDAPISLHDLAGRVGRPRAGAIVVFAGTTREVERLDYEAYAEMAHERIARILEDCLARHGLQAAAAEHRTGSVALGEASVVVAVAAAHREEAFAGARAAIDRIKAEAPIWKQEVSGERRAWAPGTPPPGGGAEASPPDGAALGASGADHAQHKLSHLDDGGSARMVDVGAKPVSERVARARACVRMSPGCAEAVRAGNGPKGEVLATARLAGIQAAKATGQLIPLAHPLPLSFIDLRARIEVEQGLVELTSEVRTVARTGVEMEAMTACAVGALTVYDMVKGLERGVQIEHVVLLEKRGGRSEYLRAERAGEPEER
jgi:molybdenum cofactor biosynthesis protein MoaC/molybdopterin converting factor subunit 1